MNDFTSLKILEDGTKIILEADPAMTTEFVSLKELEALNDQSVNSPLMHRHELPDGKPIAHIFGRIKFSEIKDMGNGHKKIVWKAIMRNRTPRQKEEIEWLKEMQKDGKKIGTSPQFESYGDEKDPDDADLLEWSVTPKPHCKTCEGRLKSMEAKEAEAKLAEMQTVLSTLKSENESIRKKYEDCISEKESIRKKFEEDLKVTKETVLKEFEEKALKGMKELEVQVKKLEEDNSRYKRDVEIARKAPYLSKLKELDSDPIMLKVYEDFSVEQMQTRIKTLEGRAPVPILTRTLEQSRNMALESSDKQKLLDEMSKKIDDLVKGVKTVGL